jgi:NAD(P)-dependent dehydrogenase (short-subunit alcohol dehydrogenase family)
MRRLPPDFSKWTLNARTHPLPTTPEQSACSNGIRVNTVAPGPTRTDTAIDTLGDGVEQMGSQTALGRTADPTEIAEAIVFFASPRASYLTGATVPVDGGYSAI